MEQYMILESGNERFSPDHRDMRVYISEAKKCIKKIKGKAQEGEIKERASKIFEEIAELQKLIQKADMTICTVN